MKKLVLMFAISCLSSFGFADGPSSSRVELLPSSQKVMNAGSIQYSFQLIDHETHQPLVEGDLVLSHTKLLHLIAYDASRNVFNHVHPVATGGNWSVELNLNSNGDYFVWAQGQLQDGTEFSASVKLQIINGQPEIPVIALGDHRTATDQQTTLQLDGAKLKAGRMAMLNYKVTREDGLSPEITPYLGALAHVIAVSPDGDELIHVHPMEVADPNSGMIHATFPSAGDYRVWVQLIDRGVLKTIPLSVTVAK